MRAVNVITTIGDRRLRKHRLIALVESARKIDAVARLMLAQPARHRSHQWTIRCRTRDDALQACSPVSRAISLCKVQSRIVPRTLNSSRCKDIQDGISISRAREKLMQQPGLNGCPTSVIQRDRQPDSCRRDQPPGFVSWKNKTYLNPSSRPAR
jgi:hypothetical protein